jgi:carbon-monoxide dehydrogenase medium subunit
MSDGVVAGARITLGCVSGTPVRARAMESALVGRVPSEEVVREAARHAGEEINPPSDAHASAAYRRQMAGVMARRAVMEAIAGARS